MATEKKATAPPEEEAAHYPEPSKLTISQRKLRLMADVELVVKRGQTQFGDRFKYARHDDVMAAVRPGLVKHGLDLDVEPSLEYSKREDFGLTKNGVMQYVWTVWVKFTLRNADDPSEFREYLWPGEGIDTGDKGVGKAVSYATKNFLLKAFLLPSGDEADNEAHEVQPTAGKPAAKPAEPKKQLTAEQKALRKFWAVAKDAGIGEDTIRGWFTRNLGLDSTKTATVEQLSKATAWAAHLSEYLMMVAAKQKAAGLEFKEVGAAALEKFGEADLRLLTLRQLEDLGTALEDGVEPAVEMPGEDAPHAEDEDEVPGMAFEDLPWHAQEEKGGES